MEISRYFATFGIRVDPKELKKVDMALMAIERKIKAWQAKQRANSAFRISNFSVDQRRLNMSLGNALDRASRQVVFEISRFVVRPGAIQAAVNRSTGALAINTPVRQRQMGPPAPGARGGMFHTAAGAGLGMMGMRPYGPMAAGGVLGYMGFRGLGALNRRNQEIMSARIAQRSVMTMFGGTEAEGDASFNWLKSEGNRLGFSYMDQAKAFTNFMANARGAGLSTAGSQDIFRGFTEFGKVKGVDPARRKLVNQALGQMLGKGVISMEELKRQMAESLPGTMAIFADAYQRMIGGDLQGQKAIAKLLTDVPKGNIESGKLLPIVAQLMSERSQAGLATATRTSQSEQERFINTVDGLLELAQPKTERAFGRLFRTFSDGLDRSTPLAMSLVGAFEGGTLIVEGFVSTFGHIIEGWTMLNQQIRLGNQGLGEMAVAAGLLMAPFTRWLTIITAGVMAIDDIVHTLRGTKEETVTKNVGRMIMEPLDNLAIGARRKRRGSIQTWLHTPGELPAERFDALLKARGEIKKHDIKDATFVANAAQQLTLHSRGLSMLGERYGEKSRFDGKTVEPISPARVAYLQREAQLDESEFRYERMLIEQMNMDPRKADIAGNKWSRAARRENYDEYNTARNLNIDVKVTGESTEEALEKAGPALASMLEEMNRDTISQFPDNEN